MARHCTDTDHPYDQVQSTSHHVCETGNRLDHLEEIETIHLAQDAGHSTLNTLGVMYNNPFLRYYLNYKNAYSCDPRD